MPQKKELLKIEVGAEFDTIIDEAELHIRGEQFNIDICFKDKQDIIIKGSGTNIKILYPESESGYVANFATKIEHKIYLINHMGHNFNWITSIKGSLCLVAPKTQYDSVKRDFIEVDISRDDNDFEVIVEQFETGSYSLCDDKDSYYHTVQKHKRDFKQWIDKFQVENQVDIDAAYCLWQNICPIYMNFKTETMVMSKDGMDRVWSCANAINALALSSLHPKIALEQFIFTYLYMDERGCVPDCVGLYNNINFFVKPPIQGWIYKHMIKNNSYFAETEQIKKYIHI